MPLTERAPGLYTADAPLSFFGLRVGTRMTVLKLDDGSLLVHSPIELSPELRREVDALGEVAHVVCPTTFHHLYAGPWKQAYSRARLAGPKALHRKRGDLRFDGEVTTMPGLENVAVEGSMLQETVFVHAKTRTLISSDLTENFDQPVDHLPTRLYLKANGTYLKVGWPRVLRTAYKDRKAARRSIDQLLEHDFDRVIVAHGRPIETGGREAIRSTFEFLG